MLLFYLSLIETEEDQLTFQHIYHTYGKDMLGIARAILNKPEAAEDAVQNAFLGIAKSIHRVPTSSEGAIRAYVLAAARNAALAQLKEEKRWESHFDITELTLPSKADTFREVLDAQNYEKLVELINQLPLQYREVLMLRYVLELTPKEIGSALLSKTTTVQQQLTRGKHALAALYAQEVAKNA